MRRVTLRLWPKQLTSNSELKGTRFCWHYFTTNLFLKYIPAICGSFACENLDIWVEEGGWRSKTKAALCGMNAMDFKVVVWKDKLSVCREVEARNEATLLCCVEQVCSHHCWDLRTGAEGALQGIWGIVLSFSLGPLSLISTALISLAERPYCVWLPYPRGFFFFFLWEELINQGFCFLPASNADNSRNNMVVLIRAEPVLRKCFDFQLLYFHITG